LRSSVALAWIEANYSPGPACLPARILGGIPTENGPVSFHCDAKLSISRSRSRNPPVKGLPSLTHAAARQCSPEPRSNLSRETVDAKMLPAVRLNGFATS
jgi:hypothetical protein